MAVKNVCRGQETLGVTMLGGAAVGGWWSVCLPFTAFIVIDSDFNNGHISGEEAEKR